MLSILWTQTLDQLNEGLRLLMKLHSALSAQFYSPTQPLAEAFPSYGLDVSHVLFFGDPSSMTQGTAQSTDSRPCGSTYERLPKTDSRLIPGTGKVSDACSDRGANTGANSCGVSKDAEETIKGPTRFSQRPY